MCHGKTQCSFVYCGWNVALVKEQSSTTLQHHAQISYGPQQIIQKQPLQDGR